jgi:hypothetical protein
MLYSYIYVLISQDCILIYIGQSNKSLKTRYNERIIVHHVNYFRHYQIVYNDVTLPSVLTYK